MWQDENLDVAGVRLRQSRHKCEVNYAKHVKEQKTAAT